MFFSQASLNSFPFTSQMNWCVEGTSFNRTYLEHRLHCNTTVSLPHEVVCGVSDFVLFPWFPSLSIGDILGCPKCEYSSVSVEVEDCTSTATQLTTLIMALIFITLKFTAKPQSYRVSVTWLLMTFITFRFKFPWWIYLPMFFFIWQWGDKFRSRGFDHIWSVGSPSVVAVLLVAFNGYYPPLLLHSDFQLPKVVLNLGAFLSVLIGALAPVYADHFPPKSPSIGNK